jgi:hypothetical protein
VEVDEVEARLAHAQRGAAEPLADGGQVVGRQPVAVAVHVLVQPVHRGGAPAFLRELPDLGGVVLLVGELRRDGGALRVHVVDQLPQPGHEHVVVDVGRGREARLDRDVAGDDEAGAAASDAAVERARPRRHHPLLLVARRHRRKDDAVAEREGAEGDGLEEAAGRHAGILQHRHIVIGL